MSKVQKKIVAADIVKEAKQILKECREFRKKFKDTPMSEDDFKELHKICVDAHHDFSSIYMLPLRTIVYTDELYDDVIEKYVNYLASNPWQNRREFLERQTVFLVLHFRRKHPRHGSTDVARYKEHCLKSLIEEDDKFKVYEKEVKETVEAEFDQLVEDRRKRIYDQLIKMKEAKDRGENVDEGAAKEEVTKLMKEIQDVNEMKKLMAARDKVMQES